MEKAHQVMLVCLNIQHMYLILSTLVAHTGIRVIAVTAMIAQDLVIHVEQLLMLASS